MTNECLRRMSFFWQSEVILERFGDKPLPARTDGYTDELRQLGYPPPISEEWIAAERARIARERGEA